MILTQIFDEIRPQCLRAFWHAWAAMGYEAHEFAACPFGENHARWQSDKIRAFEAMEAKQTELYKAHNIAF